MAGRPVPVPQTFVNRPSATPAGQPGYIPVTGGSYNPVTQSFIPTVQPSGVGPPLPPVATPTVTPAATGGGGGGVTGGGGTTVAPPPAFSALQIMENFFKEAMGITGMGSWAADLYNRGATPSEIVRALRYGTDTSSAGTAARDAYLKAFPMMDTFIKDGTFAGSSPELQYIAYRNTVKEAGARYSVDGSLLTNDKMAEYISGKNSASEIVDRMNTAATAIATTPIETYMVMKDYYGMERQDMMAFYLNTDETEKMIQRKYTAARIGTEAVRDRFGIDRAYAENLADRGISIDEADSGFGRAAGMVGLSVGAGDVAQTMDLAEAQFGNAGAAATVERAAASRKGRFEGGGSYVTEKGFSGLGSATTS